MPLREPGKLPREVHRADYGLEYGSDTLELHMDALEEGQKVVLVDDLLATGGTMRASCELVRRTGARIEGIAVLIELGFLGGRGPLEDVAPVHSVIRY